MGVWIETCEKISNSITAAVTPCVGVWIETINNLLLIHVILLVTPCVGVWIETDFSRSSTSINCHTLRGCVD